MGPVQREEMIWQCWKKVVHRGIFEAGLSVCVCGVYMNVSVGQMDIRSRCACVVCMYTPIHLRSCMWRAEVHGVFVTLHLVLRDEVPH